MNACAYLCLFMRVIMYFYVGNAYGQCVVQNSNSRTVKYGLVIRQVLKG